MSDLWCTSEEIESCKRLSNCNRKTKSLFRLLHERGDIPVVISYNENGKKILSWKKCPDQIDYSHMLPTFFHGLGERKYPYTFIVSEGNKILPLIPQLIIPIKKALETRNKRVCCNVMKVLQELLASHPGVGEALVPYYRQILPTFNYYFNCNKNIGDGIEYSQRKNENIGDMIDETLKVLEREGGKYAYFNIKYMIPVYESSVLQ